MSPGIHCAAMGICQDECDAIELAVPDIKSVESGAMGVEAQIVQGGLAYYHAPDDVATPISCHDLRCVREGAPQEELTVRLDVGRRWGFPGSGILIGWRRLRVL